MDPISKFRETLAGWATIGEEPAEFTFKITGTVKELLPEAMAMKPAYAPAAMEPALTETESTCGVVELVGITDNHVPLGKVVAVKPTADALLDTTSRFCDPVVPLVLVLKVS